MAERVIVIDHGEIIADGTHDQLKSKVSGDLLTVELPDAADGPRAAEVVAGVATAHAVRTHDDALSFRVDQGDGVMPDLVRLLDAADVRVGSLRIQRPTLDDVFLSLTGRSLRESDA